MLTLVVTPTDGEPYSVTATLFDIVTFERKYKRPASALAAEMHMEWLAFLAFTAAKHDGVTVPAVFDDYLRRLQSVTIAEDSAEGPTEGASPDA